MRSLDSIGLNVSLCKKHKILTRSGSSIFFWSPFGLTYVAEIAFRTICCFLSHYVTVIMNKKCLTSMAILKTGFVLSSINCVTIVLMMTAFIRSEWSKGSYDLRPSNCHY